jgi:hypothetical protein
VLPPGCLLFVFIDALLQEKPSCETASAAGDQYCMQYFHSSPAQTTSSCRVHRKNRQLGHLVDKEEAEHY